MDKPHKKLDVWNLSIDLVAEIYLLVKLLPAEEKYNLSSQIRKAVTSIPANVAEGAARKGSKEFIQFLCIAQGSLSGLDTHLEVARRLGFFRDEQMQHAEAMMQRIDKMISRLIQSKRSPHA